MRDAVLWTCGALAALAATGLAWFVAWLNRRGLEVIDTDVPDHVPAYLVELVARARD